ncbi:hypothetical protein CTAYLR_002993 [Chrysophaeum taylorii]|uniref:C2 domain-containing protein n=1 Tax=Chrysophaeum taylorii TaxID=2483200 RepID=A0AAD7U5R2_9STRA|nr:hypothetical protein CTAYLR_002993 [Chrysophaeum taylorii]
MVLPRRKRGVMRGVLALPLAMAQPSPSGTGSSSRPRSVSSALTTTTTTTGPESSGLPTVRPTTFESTAPTSACESAGFSCNPSCPDGGRVQAAAGGKVLVTIVRARNLPDEDGSTVPDIFGLAKLSDPFVKVKVGDGRWSRAKTRALRSKTDPVWNERLDLGWHQSGEARVVFDVRDRDRGIERVDSKNDKLGGAKMRVPYCTMFTAMPVDDCDDDMPCANTETPWEMGKGRLACREHGWLRLGSAGGVRAYDALEGQACCDGDGRHPCLEVIIEVVPFQMYVDSKRGEPYISNNYASFAVVSDAATNVTSISEDLRSPFVDGIASSRVSSDHYRGALLLRTFHADAALTSDDEESTTSSSNHYYMRVATNRAATLSLCRNSSCETSDADVQSWFFGKSSTNVVSRGGGGGGATLDRFECWSRKVSATSRDRYGFVTGDPTLLYLIDDACDANYFGLLIPDFGDASSSPAFKTPVRLDRATLAARVAQFAVPLWFFGRPALRLLRRCGYRLDRVGAVLAGDASFDGSLAATYLLGRRRRQLFGDDARATPPNTVVVVVVYWATRATQLACAMPVVILFAFGVSVAISVRPTLFGAGIVLVGAALVLFGYAVSLWEARRWRPTATTASCLVAGFASIVAFLFVAVCLDPKVVEGGGSLDMSALTCATLTATLAPLALETVESGVTVRRAKRSLALALGEADDWILRDCYTVCSEANAFDFVGDVAGDLCGFANRDGAVEMARRRARVSRCLGFLISIVYVSVAFSKTRYGPLALAHVSAISATDAAHRLLARGSVAWSPRVVIGLAATGRVAVAACGPRFWMLGHAALFAVYGAALVAEIVHSYLPWLSTLRAAEVVFLQRTKVQVGPVDASGRPEFVLGVLASVLVFFVSVASFVREPSLPRAPVGALPAYAAPVLALLGVAIFGCAKACLRAAALASAKLLRPEAAAFYFVDPRLGLAQTLGAAACWFVAASGLFLWGATRDPAAFVATLFGFLALTTTTYALRAWLRHECETLVRWPPPVSPGPNISTTTTDDDDEIALSALNSMMADAEALADAKSADLAKFAFPPLERDDNIAAIEMPVLPPPAKRTNTKVCPLPDKQHNEEEEEEEEEVLRRVIRRDLGLWRLRRDGQRPSLTFCEIGSHLFFRCFFTTTTWKQHLSDPPPDATELPLWEAWASGCLLPHEYAPLWAAVAAPCSTLALGLAIASSAGVVGHLVWIFGFAAAGLCLPVVKYFHVRHDIRSDSVGAVWLAAGSALWIAGLAVAFARLANGRPDTPTALVLLDVLVMGPAAFVGLVLLLLWRDGDRDARARVASCSRAYFLRWASAGALIATTLQVWLWGSLPMALVWLVLWGGATEWLLLFWGHHRRDAVDERARGVLFGGIVLLFAAPPNLTATAASIACLAQLFRVATRLAFFEETSREETWWFSRTVLPAFASAPGAPLRDKTRIVVRLGAMLATVLTWGACLAALAQPVSVGVFVMCIVVMVAIALVVAAVAHVAHGLGTAAQHLSSRVFVDAAQTARESLEAETRKALASPLLVEEEGSSSFSAQTTITTTTTTTRRKTALELALEVERVGRAIYADGDAFADTLDGKGPFALLRHIIFCTRRGSSRKARRRRRCVLADDAKLFEVEAMFDARFSLEVRCCVVFHTTVLAAAAAQLAYETSVFSTFVHESRYRLAANGICPPSDDVVTVAIWLNALDDDSLERFHFLQSKFRREQDAHDALEEDLREEEEQPEPPERRDDIALRKRERVKSWASAAKLSVDDVVEKEEADVLAVLGGHDLGKKYEEQVLCGGDVIVGTCEEELAELEAGERDCFYAAGKKKDVLRFRDSSFLAGPKGLGRCWGFEVVDFRWKSAFEMHLPVFDDDGDDDEVVGSVVVRDAWLVDAIGVLRICAKPLLRELFVNARTAVGAYGVRLFVDSSWAYVIVDDAFPALCDATAFQRLEKRPQQIASLLNDAITRETPNPQESATSEDRAAFDEAKGLAVAHAPNLTELSVSLVEKAVAKYFGDYGKIEGGSVHRGLEMLTGFEATRVSLGPKARGVGRLELWSQIKREVGRSIVCARTVPIARASPYARDLSLAFDGAVYAVLDARDAGQKLVKLRPTRGGGPPFSSSSKIRWSHRLRYKLNVEADHPNVAWITFDDLCAAFDRVYVCRASVGWKRRRLSGRWQVGGRRRIVNEDAVTWEAELEDTAPGLPSPGNHGCAVEQNPQFSLRLDARASVRVELSQIDSYGQPSPVVAAAVFVCRASQLERVHRLDHHTVLAHAAGTTRRLCLDLEDLGPGFLA